MGKALLFYVKAVLGLPEGWRGSLAGIWELLFLQTTPLCMAAG